MPPYIRYSGPFLLSASKIPHRFHHLARLSGPSSTACSKPNSSDAVLPAFPARWLPDLKVRLGKCIIFGLSNPQIDEAGDILRTVAQDWRELLAGSEGFLTGKGRAGCEGKEVVWGDMNFAHVIDPKHKKEWSQLWTPRGMGLILKSIRVDFKFPMKWPDKISVYHKLRSAPTASTDSFTLDVLILSEKEQRPAARCVEDIVVYDYRKGQKSSLKDFMVTKYYETFSIQQKAMQRNATKIQNLLQGVRRLEKESWDRQDAMEDIGTAKKSTHGPAR
ncbi:MAG: hypothetical protein Q9217_000064 [Psora testacea]